MIRTMASILVFLSLTSSLAAEDEGVRRLLKVLGRPDCTVVPLWPEAAGPGETRPQLGDDFRNSPDGKLLFRPVTKAEMIIIPPPSGTRSTGVTLLFCPGGGYGALETVSIAQGAKWLNAMGATAVYLKYRVPRRSPDNPAHHLPLMDAQRALGLLRSRASEWKLDPRKIGIIGFSAGGHLAAMASNHHARRTYDPVDEHDRVACRPDVCVLMYPAYLTKPILGLQLDPALEPQKMSPERTPPTFLAVVRPDKFTVGCVRYFAGLRKANVPAELHVFSSGGHGGCFDRYPLLGWGYEAGRFLGDHQFFDAAAVRAGAAWLERQESVVRETAPSVDVAGAGKKLPRSRVPSAAAPVDAIAADRLMPGDGELRKLLDPADPILPLWPADARPDDPFVRQSADRETVTTLPSDKEILRITNVTEPTLAVMKPKNPDGRAVVVFPGGGFRILASQHEGIEAGRWLTEQGITAFVVKYRVPQRDDVPVALQDAQRAVRLVRSRAAEFGIDPDWIGVMGFSAGGNMAAQCCQGDDVRRYEPVDEHDRASCRPNFGLLIYPGGLIDEQGELIDTLAKPQRNLTPPIFVAFARDDRLLEGAFPYVLALREARVPVAFHVYEGGGHGKGLRPAGYPFSQWTWAARRWLDDLTVRQK